MSLVRASCQFCRGPVWADDRGTMELHKDARGATCEGAGRRIDRSLIPSWHPMHSCGIHCDGQDGMFSRCNQARLRGPPSAVDQLSKLVDE